MMQAVVQVRGEVDMSSGVRDTMRMLNLHGVNHCTFVPAKVNDWVAHGEPSDDVVETLLRKRAEPIEGDDDVDEAWLADNTDYDDFASLAAALIDEETTLREQGLSPVLRLHPPRGGHKGLKHAAPEGGQLGKHSTEQIDDLLEAMR
jgi:large subunit ribosomal protein L30